jgi:hypothetical protein
MNNKEAVHRDSKTDKKLSMQPLLYILKSENFNFGFNCTKEYNQFF